MRIRSSLRSVGLVDSGACSESIPTSSAISMQSASITSVRSNDGSQAMTTPPYYRHNYTARGGNRVGACGWRSAGRR